MSKYETLTDSELSEVEARILVVDDNENVRSSYKSVLSMNRSPLSDQMHELTENILGYESDDRYDHYLFKSMQIDYSHVSSDALRKVDEAFESGKPYHVIFIDVQIPPEVDGILTTKIIWEKYPEQQIILCTAYSQYTFAEVNKVLQTRRHNLLMLRKPFDAESIRLITQSQIINAELNRRPA
ncbi:MAG: hypothetical protein OQL19_08775 [Gammaproteobacteria bacterium]|nr:hypothetical protein [Gammaproteobacteria bacterium]